MLGVAAVALISGHIQLRAKMVDLAAAVFLALQLKVQEQQDKVTPAVMVILVAQVAGAAQVRLAQTLQATPEHRAVTA